MEGYVVPHSLSKRMLGRRGLGEVSVLIQAALHLF